MENWLGTFIHVLVSLALITGFVGFLGAGINAAADEKWKKLWAIVVFGWLYIAVGLTFVLHCSDMGCF